MLASRLPRRRPRPSTPCARRRGYCIGGGTGIHCGQLEMACEKEKKARGTSSPSSRTPSPLIHGGTPRRAHSVAHRNRLDLGLALVGFFFRFPCNKLCIGRLWHVAIRHPCQTTQQLRNLPGTTSDNKTGDLGPGMGRHSLVVLVRRSVVIRGGLRHGDIFAAAGHAGVDDASLTSTVVREAPHTRVHPRSIMPHCGCEEWLH